MSSSDGTPWHESQREVDDLLASDAVHLSELDERLISHPEQALTACKAGDPLTGAIQCLLELNCLGRMMTWNEFVAPSGPETSPDDWSPLAAGDHFQRFEIVHELGRGGFGVVYLANDPQFGRQVALKVARPECLANPELRRRLKTEAEAAGRLTHQNIVVVHQLVEQDALCALVCSYCDGKPLHHWIRAQSSALDPSLVARLGRDLAQAIDYAHEKGVLHRDLKPANILVEPSALDAASREPQVRITDFGLAKILESTGDASRTGLLIGTPAYMAPEQFDPHWGGIGRATDIYGLGTILYELLTARPPFAGNNTLETMRKICTEEPIRPMRLRPGVPADLEAIVLKCLDKAPGQRYASGQQLADDLGRYLNAEPTLARPIGPLRRLARWSARRPAVAALIAVSVVALLTLTINGYRHNVRLTAALEESDSSRHKAESALDALANVVYGRDLKMAGDALAEGNVLDAIAALQRERPALGQPDGRGFVWHYLWRRCFGDPLIWDGHQGAVYCVTLSPDGSILATAGEDHAVQLRDAASGQPVAILRGHTGEVNCVSFSPDGAMLVSTADDGTIRLWDVPGGHEKAFWPNAESEVACAVFTSDGERIVSCDKSPAIQIWDVASGEIVRTLTGHQAEVNCLAVSSDDLLVSASSDGTARVWDLKSDAESLAFQGHAGSVKCAAFSRDGGRVATVGVDGTLRLWQADTGKQIASVQAHAQACDALAFSQDDQVLVTGGRDQIVRWWDADGLIPLDARHTQQGPVWSVATGHHDTVYSGGAKGTVQSWDRDARGDCQPIEIEGQIARTIVVHGDRVFYCRGENLVDFDLDSQHERIIGRVKSDASCLAYDAHTAMLALGWEDGDVALWSLAEQRLVRTLATNASPVRMLRFADQGRTLICACYSPQPMICCWDTATGKSMSRFGPFPFEIISLDVSADQRWLAATGMEPPTGLRVWDRSVNTAGNLAFEHPRIAAQFAMFSPDAKWLVAPTAGGVAHILDIPSWRPRAELTLDLGAWIPLMQSREPVMMLFHEDACRTFGTEHWEELTSITLPAPGCERALLTADEKTLITVHTLFSEPGKDATNRLYVWKTETAVDEAIAVEK